MPKKTRATKVTDIRGEKAWLKKSRPSTYAVETRTKNKTFLIVCEGQTEEQYFKSFPVVTASVKPIPLGCSKSTLVDCAKEIAAADEYDEVWCVFDMDIKRDIVGQKDDYNNAIKAALDANFKCAYSNDAFELWFALHFHFYEQQLDRGFYFEKLSSFWNTNYEKNGKSLAFSKEIYSMLENDPAADQQEAIKRAGKLHARYLNEPYHERNPVTLVYQLVEELNKHLRT
ncbi:MAG: RloB domain-containing protein [Pedobacter sp.]|nr:MAG: RloB domain-containing protein [Pedobacter sp.]